MKSMAAVPPQNVCWGGTTAIIFYLPVCTVKQCRTLLSSSSTCCAGISTKDGTRSAFLSLRFATSWECNGLNFPSTFIANVKFLAFLFSSASFAFFCSASRFFSAASFCFSRSRACFSSSFCFAFSAAIWAARASERAEEGHRRRAHSIRNRARYYEGLCQF